ncbi:DUF2785 domain-containing protein [Vallitalea okinawensis]|uniref:DUF2785 domain-containing protein n=1 Tax=Vallitalea okinawensis TaxID=2078660 RepID=UPI000CFCCF7B|nr:DUF2785 domain-containing protein [Vallitalea okinawensis]
MKNMMEGFFITLVLVTFIVSLTSCGASVSQDVYGESSIDTTVKSVSEEETSGESSESEANSENGTNDKQKIDNYANREAKLKENLITIKQNSYAIDDDMDEDFIIAEMIEFIGSTDSELRDDLIYMTFRTWIESGKLETSKTKGILEALLSDERLKYHIGEAGTDSVFTRSFSVLIIYSVLFYDDFKEKILTDEEIMHTYDQLITYLDEEKDCRGFVEEKGWAHAMAHSGDTFSLLAKYEVLGEEELLNILHVIGSKIVTGEHEYVDGEELRLMAAVETVLRRELVDDASLEEWVKGMIDYPQTGNEDVDRITHSNVKEFLNYLKSSVKMTKRGSVMLPYLEEFLEEN